ncbi:MAG: hypothetical protein K8S00_07665 [Bacteroidales bacterium]|nr:hypothetical protein [Bacteroidales bacterium]
MKKRILMFLVIALLAVFTACEKNEIGDDTDNPYLPSDTSAQKSYVLISNEGPFLTGTGSITRYDRVLKTCEKKVFENANNYPPGNIVQSVEVYDNKVFIIVNNANKIEIANDSSFESIAVIENISLPRYLLPIDKNKAYVSCWDDKVAVIDLVNYEVVNSIAVGVGPEKMLRYENKVFVLNIGGFGNDSTLSVIDCNSDVVDTTFFVASRPSGIVLDKHSNIWVMCSGTGFNGYPLPGDSPGHLICIDPGDYSIIQDITFPSSTEHPYKLVINNLKDILFYLYPGGIFKFNIYSSSLESIPFVASASMFYALGFDDEEELIYVSDPLDYVQQGWVFKYDATNGTVVDSFESGVIPGGFYFN